MPRNLSGRLTDWDAVQRGAEDGETFVNLARMYKVKAENIRARARRENWATPGNVKRTLNELASFELEAGKKEPDAMTVVPEVVPNLVKTEVAPVMEGDYSSFIATHLNKRMRRAIMRMPDPKTWRDIKTLDDMARRAMGLDKVTGKTAGIFSGAFGVGSFVSEISGPAFAVEQGEEG